jgi:hypothetical protein
MTPLLKCLAQVSVLVVGEWLLLTPPGNDITRPQKEWHQERSFETLQRCASYRERQADDWIKRMETVPEGSPDYVTYDRAATRFLLVSVSLQSRRRHEAQRHHGSRLTFAALSYYAHCLKTETFALRCLHPRREENSQARSLTIVKMADPLSWAL